jgi:hypothetical protein|tara:strand:+ start:2583 stop:3215 length:633 start_codon:yes stop_codon:yes gene_type:complete
MKDKIKLFKAIADFQQEAPVLLKDTDGYGYKYVTFDHIVAQIKPLLKKCNLGFSQIIEGRGLTTIIFHTETGESIQGNAEIPDIDMKGMNKYQSFGAGITYYRRYALSSMLGLLSDKDVDANIYKNDEVKAESKINKKAEDVSKAKSVSSKNVATHIDLDIGDANWDKVLSYIGRNKEKGLESIVKTLTTKYNMKANVKKVIAKEVSNEK